jgi:AGCS family alanine or glycine:cation symporter
MPRLTWIVLPLFLLAILGMGNIAVAQDALPAPQTGAAPAPVAEAEAEAPAVEAAATASDRPSAGLAPDPRSPIAEEPDALAQLDTKFGEWVVGPMATVMFFDLIFWDNNAAENAIFPIVVLWLVLGAVFFTLRMQFVNVRAFGHALKVTRGDYDNPDDPGEISHFQALSSALSATVGLGNIAGVAIAISVGGPGAIFWMVIAALLGMSSKFTECTLGQMYRTESETGGISGGPMHYLSDGLREMGYGPLGKGLAVVFAFMCIGGSFGGGNMFQANQSYVAVAQVVPLFANYSWLYGVILAFCVGLVIIGGIKRIGAAASVIVPVMCGVYMLAGLWILIVNASAVPAAFGAIIGEAFSPVAGFGGMLGVIAQGFKRASFSNEAGIGSASIAHSAAATKEPVREGIVALLEPFIDTVCVCTMTGLVVVVTGAYHDKDLNGVEMTAAAFGSVIDWFPMVLSFAVVMFAFSTMISWSYYGEKCAIWLFGEAEIGRASCRERV